MSENTLVKSITALAITSRLQSYAVTQYVQIYAVDVLPGGPGQRGLTGETGAAGADGDDGAAGAAGADGLGVDMFTFDIPSGATYVDVLYESAQAADVRPICPWVAQDDNTKAHIFAAPFITNRTTAGFRVYLSGATPDGTYDLIYGLPGNETTGSGGGASVSDTVYGAGWNGETAIAPSKNTVYDKIEAILAGVTFTGDVAVPDEAYGVGWNGSLEVPTKNAVYDKIESLSAAAVDEDAQFLALAGW